jgi:UDP-N-acetylglucosamine 2-epimerase (non-hydrolysing)
MRDTSTIACVVGTRPEVIKMAPVIRALQATGWARVRVLATAQHRGLLDQALADFGLVPDRDLDLMRPDQTLAALTARLVEGMDAVLADEAPDFVLAQGDTTTVLATALCCFYRDLPFGHVEAGLRTGQRRVPFPEEMNRVVAGVLATQHYAPPPAARDALLAAGVDAATIHLTGNTVIDSLLWQAARNGAPATPGLRRILVTAHRRENFGAPMEAICAAIVDLVARHPDVDVLFPVHPNPNVGRVVHERLGGRPRIALCAPLAYPAFVAALQDATLVLTDSGGVQEEAPALGKPVLVMRTDTERPEAVAAGVAKLVGVDRDAIVAAASALLEDAAQYRAMARGVSPYGDGHAAARITASLARHFGRDPGSEPAPWP